MAGRILVGTRKGTFICEKTNGKWKPKLSGHSGSGVNFVACDPNSGTLWAALGHGHWGAKLSRSRDKGATWEDAPQVKFPEGTRYIVPEFGDDSSAEGDLPPAPKPPKFKDAAVQKLWVLGFGKPGSMYIGTIPGGLFESHDGGETFNLNRGLWDHASRGGDISNGKDPSSENHWFGTPASEGGDFAPGIHSIVVDPRDPNHIMVAISTAGVLRSRDGGKTWASANKGLSMDYLPDPNAEWGHDPHYVELCPGSPDHVWQQNHCGVFYSADGAQNWRKVSKPEDGVHFGFPVAADASDGKTAWVVPGKADNSRMAIDGGLFVARTEDGGESWKQLREGLPQENVYDLVYRHAFSNHEGTLAFGSTTGNLYVSEDRGDTWQTVSNNLPPIYSVRIG